MPTVDAPWRDRCAIVVGSASGIGAGLCRMLAAGGAAIELIDRDLDGAEALAAQLREAGRKAWAQQADVTDPASLGTAAAAIRARHAAVDLLFANAGAIILKPFLASSLEDWRWLTEVNLLGTVNTIGAFLPAMLGQAGMSRLVITSSLSVLRAPAIAGQSLYVATKAAQLGLFAGLERELQGTSVRPTILFPGPVRTELRARSLGLRVDAVPGDLVLAPPDILDPDAAARLILSGIAEGRRFVTTHPGERANVAAHLARLTAAFDEAGGCGGVDRPSSAL